MKRLKDSCMFVTGRWLILGGERAITATVISLPLLSTLSHALSVSHSHILSLAPIGSFSCSHVSLRILSLEVITSLRLVWRASRHMTHHQSLLIPSPSQLIWREGWRQGKVHFSVCLYFLQLIWEDLSWGECDCRSGGYQGAASPSAYLTDSVLCVLTSEGNQAALFPHPPCSTGINWCRVQCGLDWRKTKTMKLYGFKMCGPWRDQGSKWIPKIYLYNFSITILNG